MSALKTLLSRTGKDILSEAGSIVDNLSTSNEEKSNAKARLSEIVFNALGHLAQVRGQVIQSEMAGNWLQKSWRPVLMLTFGGVILCKWFGITDANISEALELELLSIIKLGLGGYVIGRSVEKVSEQVTRNIDLPFLRKRNRNT